MKYLLDSNVWITVWKQRGGPIDAKLSFQPISSLYTCSLIYAELLHGAMKYEKPERRMALIHTTLGRLKSFAFDDGTAAIYGMLRDQLERAGTPIGPFDFQIAAIALQHECTLVTNNTREFSRVQGLRIEDWSDA